MKPPAKVKWFGGILLALAAIFALARLVPEPPAPRLKSGEVMLATLDGRGTQDPAKCAAERCLTVYVSPWCSVCQASTAYINELRSYLAKRGVETKIIVGRGKPDKVKAYAPAFGPDTLLDAAGDFPLRGGVPNFTVTTRSGEVLKVIPGVPAIYRPPIPEGALEEMSRYLGLI